MASDKGRPMGMKDFEERSDHSKFAQLIVWRPSSALNCFGCERTSVERTFHPSYATSFPCCFSPPASRLHNFMREIISGQQLQASKCFHNPVRASIARLRILRTSNKDLAPNRHQQHAAAIGSFPGTPKMEQPSLARDDV